MLSIQFHVNQTLFALVTGYYLLQERRGKNGCWLEARLPHGGCVQQHPRPSCPPGPLLALPLQLLHLHLPSPRRLTFVALALSLVTGCVEPSMYANCPPSMSYAALLHIVGEPSSFQNILFASVHLAELDQSFKTQLRPQTSMKSSVLPIWDALSLSPFSWFALDLCPIYNLSCPDRYPPTSNQHIY